MPTSEVAEGLWARGHRFGEDRRTIALGNVAIDGSAGPQFVFESQAAEQHGDVFNFRAQRSARSGLVDVDDFLDILPRAFQPQSGSDRKFSENKSVFHEHRSVENFALGVVAQHARVGIGRGTTRVLARGIGVIQLDSAGEGMGVLPTPIDTIASVKP